MGLKRFCCLVSWFTFENGLSLECGDLSRFGRLRLVAATVELSLLKDQGARPPGAKAATGRRTQGEARFEFN
jgi:hypothetical protein